MAATWPPLHQGSGTDAGRAELDRFLHLRWRRRRALGCRQQLDRYRRSCCRFRTRRYFADPRSAAGRQRLGFGTVGAGYDWQFNGKWVAGIFADGQFGDIRGSLSDPFRFTEGREKLRTSYAAGVRLGYLVAPNVLVLPSTAVIPVPRGQALPRRFCLRQHKASPGTQTTTSSFHRIGWFIGGGVENNLDIFGITAPDWFMKTEYRSAYYDRILLPTTFAAGNAFNGGTVALTGEAITFKPRVQTISTSLVYRFNWTGPVVAKY